MRKGEEMSDESVNIGGVDAERLLSYIERVERIEEEKKQEKVMQKQAELNGNAEEKDKGFTKDK